MNVTKYPANVRWLSYDGKRFPGNVAADLLRSRPATIAVGVGSAAAAWGLMHLILHLLR